MQKVENFQKALANLELSKSYLPPYDVVTLTGLVNLFSICFEQSWKMMKDILTRQGYDESATGSPRMILKLAYKSGMIQSEDLWLEILDRRNEVAHSYSNDAACEIIEKVKSTYLNVFEELDKTIRERWINA